MGLSFFLLQKEREGILSPRFLFTPYSGRRKGDTLVNPIISDDRTNNLDERIFRRVSNTSRYKYEYKFAKREKRCFTIDRILLLFSHCIHKCTKIHSAVLRYWIRVVSRGNLQNPIFIVKESTKVGEERERERDMRRRCWTKQNDCASVLCPVEKRSRRDFFSIVSLALSLLLLGTLPVWLYQGEEKETKARGGGGVCYGRM